MWRLRSERHGGARVARRGRLGDGRPRARGVRVGYDEGSVDEDALDGAIDDAGYEVVD
ncbi:hypothetical protein ACFQGT_15930 [Natrialbaceae archaeon GCM10025810]|uniref:hypothetical protein n=1 Tax=Halovalidus salilacus TaxID=3075124 RepID=UPI00361107A8